MFDSKFRVKILTRFMPVYSILCKQEANSPPSVISTTSWNPWTGAESPYQNKVNFRQTTFRYYDRNWSLINFMNICPHIQVNFYNVNLVSFFPPRLLDLLKKLEPVWSDCRHNCPGVRSFGRHNQPGVRSVGRHNRPDVRSVSRHNWPGVPSDCHHNWPGDWSDCRHNWPVVWSD